MMIHRYFWRAAPAILALFAVSAGAQTCPSSSALYPSGLDGDAQLAVASNGVATYLNAALTAGATTFSPVSSAGMVANMYLSIDSEIVFLTATSPLTIARGCDGTVAAGHLNRAAVQGRINAGYHNTIRKAVQAIELNTGITSSPTFNNLTITGTCTGCGGGTFNALTGDATSTSSGGATEVIGLLNHALPSLAPGYLNWTGSAWALSSASGGGIININSQTGPAFTIAGTSNEVTVTNSTNTATLSLPQAIASTSSPTFNNLTITGTCTGCGGGGGGITSINSQTGPAFTVAGTSNEVIVTNSTNTATFSLPQQIGVTSSVNFGTIAVSNPGVASSLIPTATNTYSLGGSSNLWFQIYGSTVLAGNMYPLTSGVGNIGFSSSPFAEIYSTNAAITDQLTVGSTSQLVANITVTNNAMGGNPDLYDGYTGVSKTFWIDYAGNENVGNFTARGSVALYGSVAIYGVTYFANSIYPATAHTGTVGSSGAPFQAVYADSAVIGGQVTAGSAISSVGNFTAATNGSGTDLFDGYAGASRVFFVDHSGNGSVQNLTVNGTCTGCGAGIASINSQTGPAFTIAGTSNEVTVTNSTNTVTLGLPQAIASTSSPQFNNLTITGACTGCGGPTIQTPGIVVIVGTVYHNTTTKPIWVNVIGPGAGLAYCDGSSSPTTVVAATSYSLTSSGNGTLSFIVLPGFYWQVSGLTSTFGAIEWM